MATFLFDSIVFGPVKSRRLGSSLGINLLPVDGKICSFDCIYCECGLNSQRKSVKPKLPDVNDVDIKLRETLKTLSDNNECPDVITFAGNGEPTLHPHFLQIIQNTLHARNDFCPDAKVSVLSNSSRIWDRQVFDALNMVDMNILKLDSAIEQTVKTINNPQAGFSIDKCIRQLKEFKGNLIIQTLFCRGHVNGMVFDNTTDKELDAWTEAIVDIGPKLVMIYSISRDTPINSIQKVGLDELNAIASRLESCQIPVEVS